MSDRYISSHAFGKELCTALGLDPNELCAIEIKCSVDGGTPEINVTRRSVEEGDVPRIREALGHYRLVEADEVAPETSVPTTGELLGTPSFMGNSSQTEQFLAHLNDYLIGFNDTDEPVDRWGNVPVHYAQPPRAAWLLDVCRTLNCSLLEAVRMDEECRSLLTEVMVVAHAERALKLMREDGAQFASRHEHALLLKEMADAANSVERTYR